MSTIKKPHADAKLKTLPQERRDAIFEFMGGHSHEETIKWLKQDGISVSGGTLTRFWQWYQLQQQLEANESTVEVLLDKFKESDPNATPERIQQIGQAFFSALALQQQNAKVWSMTQRLALKREQLQFDQQRFQFDAAKAALKHAAALKVIATDKSLTEAQRVDRARVKLFGEAAT